ncbi:unnamed protein product [Cyclocybe aegerita]|uniref:Borealin N-terminal domain-containing protein n=1 Tax=Cyclocybe aegerita TaxID=1973307 RepID=A0A8S0WG90_CYCAE|nr:unnamed protein product [Cyclocybe aegerita]
MDLPSAKRHYSDEEKRQLIANLDIEGSLILLFLQAPNIDNNTLVAHRTRQFEAWLTDRLENFTIHQEGQVSRIPKQVRAMTMREFGEKYEGNIQSALRGFQKERLAAAGADATLGEIDKSVRKRKWVASQEAETEASGSSQPKETDHRAPKNARTQLSSPKKVAGSSTGPGTAQRARLLTSLKTRHTMTRLPPPSHSPQKHRPPFNNTTSTYNPRPPSRPASPLKHTASKPSTNSHAQQPRVPSSSTFNPTLPPKTPAFPPRHGHDDQTTTVMRLPRKDEDMLSVNGSPLANPYQFGLGWFGGVDAQMEEDSQEETNGTNGARTLKRTKSSIVIRQDPSVALSGLHSRTDSQASFYTASSQTATSSREELQASTQPFSSQQTSLGAFRFPSTRPNNSDTTTPRPMTKHTRSFSALVAIPTKDGHLLEFDPLQTSPGALDALEGISDSAKKQAKAEMGRLIQATVDKWKIR